MFQKWWDVTSKNRLHRECGFQLEHSFIVSHMSPLMEAICQVVSCLLGRPMWLGSEGGLWLTANGKLIASVQQSIKDCILAIPWKRVWKWLSAKPLDETATQTNTLTEALWGSLRQRHPADLQSDSWLIEMEKTNDYCVKPLSFGVILFMAFSVSLSLNLSLSSITLPPASPNLYTCHLEMLLF